MTDENIAESSPAPEAETEQDVSQEVESSTTEAVDTTEGQEDQNKGNNVQKRINKLTREKYEAQNRAKELEDKYKSLEERLNNLDTPPAEPNYNDYETEESYKQAFRDYVLKTEQHSNRVNEAKAAENLRLEEQQKIAAQRVQDFSNRARNEANRYEGYWEAVQDPAFEVIVNTMNPDVVALIQESEKSTGLSYHLATNLEIADQLANMPIATAARELLKLENSLDLPQAKQVSNAPDPTEPLGSSGQNEVPLDRVESIDEWMARRNAQTRR